MPAGSCRPFGGQESRSDPNADPDHAGSGRRHWSGEVWKATTPVANSTKWGRKRPLNVQPNLRDQEAAGSSPATPTNLNDPTQSEQIVVSCSDRVGSFVVCSPYISRTTGFFNSVCHVSLTESKQFKIRVQNTQMKGFEPHCCHPR